MKSNDNTYHPSVMLEEVCALFVNNPKGIYIDATCGGGGHSYALLQKHPEIKIISLDWDMDAIKFARERLAPFGDRSFVEYGNFSLIDKIVKQHKLTSVDGIMADFGTSRHQILHQDGFSFMYDSFLDMRMSKGFFKITASDILAKASEKELCDIFYNYGQERYARKIARTIVQERKKKPIRTTLQLASLIELLIPRKNSAIHPATKIFQALRIAVNNELKEIELFLKKVPPLLHEQGRLLCISFHSLEDGLVKQFAKDNKQSFAFVDSKKFLKPSEEEIASNRASRSAIMRILCKKC